MIDERPDMLERLKSLQKVCEQEAATFSSTHGSTVEALRREVSRGLDEALQEMRTDIAEISADNPMVERLGEQLSEYATWTQWALWDLPVLAVGRSLQVEDFRDAVTACGLVYIAVRFFDDVIDEHYSYKGRHDTYLGTATATDPDKAPALATLAALLLCFEGVSRLSRPQSGYLLDHVVVSIRRAIVGAIMELDGSGTWTLDDYAHLVQLKNVDYWRSLYAAVDPDFSSPLYPFLADYTELAQYLNDIHDVEDDLIRGQPNFAVLLTQQGVDGCPPVDSTVPLPLSLKVESVVADRLLALGNVMSELPDPERGIAGTKLTEAFTALGRIGIFDGSEATPVMTPSNAGPSLFWYSEMADVVQAASADGVEDVDCPVCGSPRRHLMFHKQGFPFRRCVECSHVYPSPRMSARVQRSLLVDLDDLSCEDKYLEVQRQYAELICDLLRHRTQGARLLDIGFGRGYLLQMAQVYGFEVFGVDSSHAHVEHLRPHFSDRVARCVVGEDTIPWGEMDVVVMSHVLEHLHEPESVLANVAQRMNPGGLLYIAVPDIDSAEFRVFGKTWDVINPMAHLQYFSNRSLTRLLEAIGFEHVERVQHPLPVDEISPRWARLMRHLGGDEVGELTLLARAPGEAL